MKDLVEAFYLTWPLWAYLAVLGVGLFVEEGITEHSKRKMVDNPTLW